MALRGTPISQNSAKASFNSIPEVTRDFTLVGLKEGRTVVVARGQDDTLLASMIVSVKLPRTVKYNVHVLRDAVRPKDVALDRTLSQMNTLMTTVERAYLNSANVVLEKSRESILTIGADLGDPFDPEQTNEALKIDNHTIIVDKLRKGAFLKIDTVNVVSTWNIKDDDATHLVLGLTKRGTHLSYVERMDNAAKEACTIAHEVGHGFGLTHNLVDGTMMARASGNRPSFFMLRQEIDFLNGSAGGALIFPTEPPD